MSAKKNEKQQTEMQKTVTKPWPADCIWPEPSDDSGYWEAEDAESLPGDDVIDELLEIKAYMDGLVESGRLNEDYSLNDEYDEDDADEPDEPFSPEQGVDYWDDGFDYDSWKEDLAYHLNLLKQPLPSPVAEIERIIGYEFINENLLRQAFTRRSFGVEYGIGDCEGLEFIGDTVLDTVVTREMSRQLTEVDVINPHEPFSSSYTEGQLTQVRQHFVNGEYLAARASALGLEKYILYGSSERTSVRADEKNGEGGASESALEDMMEAVIGAVAVDCNWDWYTLEAVVDKLLCVQLNNVSAIFRPNYYDTFNAWHQKHFGRIPEYEVSRGTPTKIGPRKYNYHCTIRFSVPENDKGVATAQSLTVLRETRSKARELAAEQAYAVVVNSGLWMRLDDSNISPTLEDSINQLQELYQKKYITQPEYRFEERSGVTDGWYCNCKVNGIEGWGKAKSKTAAKKKAAFMVLVRLFDSAGIGSAELDKKMWETME